MTARLDILGYLIGEAWRSIKRHPLMSVASMSNVAVCLCLLGSFGLTVFNINHLVGSWAQEGQVIAYLAEGADGERVLGEIVALPQVQEVEHLSRQDAAAWLREVFGEAVDRYKGRLPEGYAIRPRDPEQIPAIDAQVRKIDGVSDVAGGGVVLERILVLRRAVQWGGGVVSALLVFATFVVIQGTIRLTVYNRRREIRIMQLVGASNSFIRVPFVLEGLYYGLVGALVAALLLLVAYFYVHDYADANLKFVPLVYGTKLYVVGTALLMAMGASFGAGGSLVSLRRFLRLA